MRFQSKSLDLAQNLNVQSTQVVRHQKRTLQNQVLALAQQNSKIHYITLARDVNFQTWYLIETATAAKSLDLQPLRRMARLAKPAYGNPLVRLAR